MSISTHGRTPASTFLTHFFGRGLVDEGHAYAVERFTCFSNGDIRRRPAETRGGHVRRGPGDAPGLQ